MGLMRGVGRGSLCPMSIATKTGDRGTCGLMYGRRVSKTHIRVDAYGAVDELNAALGMARALSDEPFLTGPLRSIQVELVNLMGELAVSDEDRERYQKDGYDLISAASVDRLTSLIEELETRHHLTFKHWATPGATPSSAALDVARTICRRAEREVVRLGEASQYVNPESVRYLNRLSDLCWLYARWVETRAEDS